MDAIIVDALARGRYGRRVVTVDAIGAGPRTVAGVLEQKGLDVRLAVAEEVLDNPRLLEDYDVLLISAMSIDEPTVKRIIRIWRRRRRGPAIVGGPIASDPDFVARVGADLGIHGESEPVLDRLVDTGWLENPEPQRLEGLCGIAYPNKGKVVIMQRCPIMPRRVWEKYRPSTRVIKHYPLYWAARVYLEVVRGCSNYTLPRLDDVLPPNLLPEKPRPGCAYCSVVSLWGYARSRSIDLVVQEARSLIEQGVRRIVLSGPDFLDYGRDWLVEPKPLIDPKKPLPNIEAIERLLSRIASIPEIASGEASVMVENVKPNLVSNEAAAVMGKYLAGTPVHVGVETGDDRLLAKLGRPALSGDALRAVKLLAANKLRPYVYIMYCLPGETWETIKLTLKLMDELYRYGVEKITAYRFMPLPLSYLEKLREAPQECIHDHPVKKRAEEINKKAKRRMRGMRLRAIVAGRHPKYGKPVAYPLKHGPVMLLDRHLRLGDLVLAEITGTRGDHLATARVVRLIGNVAPTEAPLLGVSNQKRYSPRSKHRGGIRGGKRSKRRR